MTSFLIRLILAGTDGKVVVLLQRDGNGHVRRDVQHGPYVPQMITREPAVTVGPRLGVTEDPPFIPRHTLHLRRRDSRAGREHEGATVPLPRRVVTGYRLLRQKRPVGKPGQCQRAIIVRFRTGC